MKPDELFEKALQQATRCIRAIKADQLGNSTPCTDWSLKELLNHMVYELLWMPEIIAGKTINEVGDRYEGDVTGHDYLAAWERAAEAALDAVRPADLGATAHVSYGDIPLGLYITEAGSDMFIHGWDVGQAIQCTVLLDNSVAQALYSHWLPKVEDLAKSGQFGSTLKVADDATIQTKLLGLLGRKG